jgi:hypothetical protein
MILESRWGRWLRVRDSFSDSCAHLTLAITDGKPMRSEDLAFSVQTNAAFIRSLLSRLIASGSDFGPGTKCESANVVCSYMRQILGFIGIADVKIVLAGGILAVDMRQKSLDDFIAPIESGLWASGSLVNV